jgi:integrase
MGPTSSLAGCPDQTPLTSSSCSSNLRARSWKEAGAALKLYRNRLDSGLAPHSVNYIHVTLHKALEQAVLDGLVPRNVSEGVKAPQVHKEEVKPLSPSQIQTLLSAARGDRLEALYVLAIHTGLRHRESC